VFQNLIGNAIKFRSEAAPEVRVGVDQVRAGDTLWTIASKLAPTKDPREIIDTLMKANHLGSPTIVPGQTLRFTAP